MPRKPKPPEPLLGMWWKTADKAEADQRFEEGVRQASRLFRKYPEAGRLWALKAMTYHVLARFRDDPGLVELAAPFSSLVTMHHPHRANADPPARWTPKVHLAAALDALMLIPGTNEAEEAARVFGVAEDVGLPLKREREDKASAATVVNLRKNYLAGHGDPGAIKTFEQLRFEWAELFGDRQDPDRWKKTVLADLRARLAELVAEVHVRAVIT